MKFSLDTSPLGQSDRWDVCRGSWQARLGRGADSAFIFLVGTTRHGFARGDLGTGQEPLENVPALAKGGHRAVLHDGNLVRYAPDPDPVGDDDDGGIGRLHPFNSVEKPALAERVEAGVRLVEDHEVRVAENRPRKAEAEANPARQIDASASDDRIVRLRQPGDRLVNAGQLCR